MEKGRDKEGKKKRREERRIGKIKSQKKNIRTLNMKEAILTARSFVFNWKRFLLLT